jgi:hypothetical protein
MITCSSERPDYPIEHLVQINRGGSWRTLLVTYQLELAQRLSRGLFNEEREARVLTRRATEVS